MTDSPAPVRILIATGATGGHLFPALSLAEAIGANHPEAEIHLVLNRTADFARQALSGLQIHVHAIPFRPPHALFSFSVLQILIEYVKAFWNITGLLNFLKPKVIIGFGSFGAVPAVLCGACFGIPIVLHEQNARAGRANRFLSYWADVIAVSFPETLGLPARKIICTGFPVRAPFLSVALSGECLKQGGEEFTVLVFGGSQGARRLNAVFLEALALFRPEEKVRFAVIHITGSDDSETVQKTYRDLGVSAQVLSFSREIEKAFVRADLVISRAGAGTIFELATVGRAAILIPYPFAYAHQEANAEYLARRGWVRALGERELNSERLYQHICDLRTNVNLRREMENGIRGFACPDAAARLMETAWKL